MIKYFVSYAIYYKDDIRYIVSGEVEAENPIAGISDIRQIEDIVSKRVGMDSVTIINWRRFENPQIAELEE